MARRPIIRDETIIAAARSVFLQRGIRATTAEVAQEAGVSEGSIFKRFKSKEELFEAAMAHELLEDPPLLRLIEGAVGQEDLHAALLEIGEEYIALLRQVVPLSLMLWSNAGLVEDGRPRILCRDDAIPRRLLRAITQLFDAEQQRGRLRRHDASISARALMGALHNYVVFEILYGEDLSPPPRAFIEGLLDIALHGLLVHPPGSPTPPRA